MKKPISELVFCIWIILSGISFYFWLIEIDNVQSENTFLVILGCVVYMMILLVFFRSFYIKRYLNNKSETNTNYNIKEDLVQINGERLFKLQKDQIKTIVGDLFKSLDFKQAVVEHLPDGNLGKEGLDYMKFILVSLERKKESLKKTTQYFLAAATSLTIIFSLVVLFFGYSLIESDSVGFNKSLKNLDKNLVLISENQRTNLIQRQRILAEKIIGDTESVNTKILSFRKKLEDNFGEKYSSSFKINPPGVANLIEQENDINFLTNRTDEIRDSINTIVLESGTSNELEKDKNEILKYLKEYQDKLEDEKDFIVNGDERIQKLYSDTASSLNLVGNKVETLNKDNYLQEFLKRLAIGVIVVSFFLAIIRFCIGQYKLNYKEMIATDSDGLLVRKSFVALKNIDDVETKKLVYQSFFDKIIIPQNSDNYKNIDVNELLKSIMGIIQKKGG
ncbi:hypothetical protein [Maribacter sp. 2307UL18-2]|uniref:hypothetical protein n=1 Tax=Maribacter sp. 2307UL18-2 TaxID=3386274 RepID=UPI0039BD7E6A